MEKSSKPLIAGVLNIVAGAFTLLGGIVMAILTTVASTTLFHYINSIDIFVKHMWPIRDMAVLMTVMIAATLLGGIIWQRRDLSV